MIYRLTKKTIAAYKPDIVHIMKNELYPAIYGLNLPTIVSCHSSSIDLYNAFHIRYALKHATKIHCVSEFTKKLVDSLITRDDKDIRVIPNFVDLSTYKRLDTNRSNSIVTIARLQKSKN